MSRLENFCLLEPLFGSVLVQIILILGRFCLYMQVLAWYLRLTGIKNKNIVEFSYLIGLKKCEILIVDT